MNECIMKTVEFLCTIAFCLMGYYKKKIPLFSPESVDDVDRCTSLLLGWTWPLPWQSALISNAFRSFDTTDTRSQNRCERVGRDIPPSHIRCSITNTVNHDCRSAAQ